MPDLGLPAIVDPTMATLQERKQQQHERLLATAKRAAIANSPDLKAIRAAIKVFGNYSFITLEEAQTFFDNESERIAREDLKQMSLTEPS